MTRAAILTNVGDPLEIWGITHQPLEHGQVRVRMIAAGICGAQLMEIDGYKGNHFPRLMGHEGVGIVQAIGAGVRNVKVGQKVILHWRPGSGIESDFPQWNHSGGRTTCGLVTTWSTDTVVSENRCTAVPDDTDDDLCVLLGCGLSTALGVIENELNLRMGEKILIIGCGGVGMNLILASNLRQASVICVVDVENKEALAMALGATHFTTNWEDIEAKFDAIVDTTGNINAIEHGLQLIASGGTFIMLGHPKARQSFMFYNAVNIVHGSQCIKGTQGGSFDPTKDIPRYTALWKHRGINLTPLITDRVSLNEVNAAVSKVRSGHAGRVIINLA